jgi:dolichyl-phosphate-mannose--protein O-mannosyl transferase
MPLCFGLQNLVLSFLIASSLFHDRRAGWLAAAFMAADGFHLAYSRAALPDIILASGVLWSLLAAVIARGWAGVLTCAVLVGLAASIKWVGLFVAVPAWVALLLLKRAPRYWPAAFAVVPFVHLAVWMLGLKLLGQPYDPFSVWAEIRYRQGLHLGFPHHANPAESPWYSWLGMVHPLVIKSWARGSTVRLASAVGNPLLWLTTDLWLVLLPAAGAAFALKRGKWRRLWGRLFDATANRAMAILGIAWLSMMLLWISGRIVTYWYHYLTPWAIALTLLGGIASRLERKFPKKVLVFVITVLLVSAYFAPVWAELPISLAAAHRRLVFPLWR